MKVGAVYKNLSRTTKRGITLLETLLALAVGAIVIVASIQGINRYTESVQVQASASQLERLIIAMDTFADDNYDNLITNAPQVFTPAQTQTALISYLGSSFPVDAFRNNYRIATRTYTYAVPDLANPGNTVNRDAIQILLVGFNTNPGPLATEDDIRINIANTAGARAGFISTAVASCSDGAGGILPPGNICGAFGSYALTAASFAPTALDNAFVVGLVTKGDSSFYGDQLYRYNYGDPELNTMRTTLFMDSPADPNEIYSPRFDLTVRGEEDILIDAGETGRTVFVGDAATGTDPIVRSNTNILQVGQGAGRIRLGDIVEQTYTTPAGSTTGVIEMGTGGIRGNAMFSNIVRTDTINSLFALRSDPLRIQNFRRGEVIIGQRGRYTPRFVQNNGTVATSSSVYELSDGKLTAGHVVTQDVTCADCGGSLSEVLPRWRHMGTYYVAYTQGSGTSVPKPACTSNRRNTTNRGASSDEQAFQETGNDTRYRPSILLIPRQIRSKNFTDSVNPNTGSGYSNRDISDIPIDSHLRAINNGNNWLVRLHKSTDNIYTTAFALTYCVFTGGETRQFDPADTFVPDMMDNTPGATWVALP